eukprot:1448092-Pyramimonas_sp.AAC.2
MPHAGRPAQCPHGRGQRLGRSQEEGQEGRVALYGVDQCIGSRVARIFFNAQLEGGLERRTNVQSLIQA